MGMTVVMGSSGRKASDLGMGESVEGYLVGLAESKYNFSIKLLSKDGKVETVYPNGNLSYLDQEIENGDVTLNAYTKITRSGTRTSTKSRDSNGEWRQVPVFQVAQDKSDIISDTDAKSALSGDAASSAPSETSGAPAGGSKFANRTRR